MKYTDMNVEQLKQQEKNSKLLLTEHGLLLKDLNRKVHFTGCLLRCEAAKLKVFKNLLRGKQE